VIPPAASSVYGEPGSFEPTCVKLPYVPHVPATTPSEEESVADARESRAPVPASPEAESLPFARAMLSVVEVE
jgi:hypothetical protein